MVFSCIDEISIHFGLGTTYIICTTCHFYTFRVVSRGSSKVGIFGVYNVGEMLLENKWRDVSFDMTEKDLSTLGTYSTHRDIRLMLNHPHEV